jgi:hypothetical protein
VLGQRFQHYRSSNFIGGVGRDAAFVADHTVRGQGDGDSDPAPPGSAGTCLLTETATRTSRSGCAGRPQDVEGSRR